MTKIQDDIDLFFTNPSVEPKLPGVFSVLYLLRRDIKECINAGRILWPATMAILAGVDLLGKFYAGEDGHGVGARFRSFVNQYFQPISSEDAETVYQLRNALLHSFGLYSKSSGGEYYFTLILQEAGPLVVEHVRAKGRYLISIRSLYDKFETAIQGYRSDLDTNSDLQGNFGEMYNRYGTIRIGEDVLLLSGS
jgi:hypothetical protein